MSPDWELQRNTQHISVASPSTSIEANGVSDHTEGRFQTKQTHMRITLNHSVSVQTVLREPLRASGKHPACLLIQGAGETKSSQIFGDIASAMASSGIVTLVVDKPLDNYSLLHRDYGAMADEYLTMLSTLQNLPNVDSSKTGIYAESEGTWISMIMASKNRNIPFMILTSPPVVSGRQQMTMAAATYLTTAGAPKSLIAVVPRLMSLDFSAIGLNYADFPAEQYMNSLTMPLLINYGVHDPAMPIEQGPQILMDHAAAQANHNVTVRYYHANHQMRTGSALTLPGLALEPTYTRNLENWITAISLGANADSWQTPQIAGAQPHQEFAVPSRTDSGFVSSIGVLITLMVAIALLLVCALFLCVVLFARRRRYPIRFAPGIRGLLAANALWTTAISVAFVSYFVSLARDAFLLHDNGRIFSIQWTLLQVAAVFSAVLFSTLLVQLWTNRSFRFPLANHAKSLPQSVTVGRGFGAHAQVACVMGATAISLFLLAFWGLFSL